MGFFGSKKAKAASSPSSQDVLKPTAATDTAHDAAEKGYFPPVDDDNKSTSTKSTATSKSTSSIKSSSSVKSKFNGVKGEVQPRKVKDLSFSILFFLHVGAMIFLFATTELPNVSMLRAHDV